MDQYCIYIFDKLQVNKFSDILHFLEKNFHVRISITDTNTDISGLQLF